ncbi:TetR/AcrR family transcriptional regulator [Hyphomicrobiales bacterium]|jgi:TetR/AcrR family transcriptional repressor of lmrAB and yxaGH operons|nr:TetR/AcrR family transcriptional regulator [Rhodobiaceae bacterium]MDB4128162.1 TetR/AcrR family transcriptional regulator [Hyphomicrobiales bacterium]MBT6223270.1 TetR/AcrR family transcriptional regulator [Rhodobiaceae bacterium]MDB4831499.1 TetR/AcrR family transcriptional regulator [Hyphomicrobiales bacterium]MDC0139421.1 TetR/AcrR family transcriptional regulator [Hyphomicrobiales bacterium]|tara:strand:- start:34766 stop:35329 length:564 start_codon:yes stop_codon:yes gene_type:complete
MVKITSYRDLVDDLVNIFCNEGYDGSSLTILSKNTGLGRASLYYHFPGGKEEMARAVYDRISKDFTRLVLSPLAADVTFEEKIKAMVSGIDLFYKSGRRSCLIDVFAIGGSKKFFSKEIHSAILYWIDSLARIFMDRGVNEDNAKIIAEEAIITIEGSLVFVRATGNYDSFKRTLENISKTLLSDIG